MPGSQNTTARSDPRAASLLANLAVLEASAAAVLEACRNTDKRAVFMEMSAIGPKLRRSIWHMKRIAAAEELRSASGQKQLPLNEKLSHGPANNQKT